MDDEILEDPSEHIAEQSAKQTAGPTSGQTPEKPPTVAAVAKAIPAESARVEVAPTAAGCSGDGHSEDSRSGKDFGGRSARSAPKARAVSGCKRSGACRNRSSASKKKLFWSSALTPAGDASKAAEPDQSHVPPVLRGLSKCEACGFPISAGRKLCVECEEKKWRGQLKVPQAATVRPAVATQVVAPVAPAAKLESPKPELQKREDQAFAAAAQTKAVVTPTAASTLTPISTSTSTSTSLPRPQSVPAVTAAPQVSTPPAAEAKASKVDAVQAAERVVSGELTESAAVRETTSPDVVFSGGLEPSQSWLSANKYILGVLLVIAGAAAAVYFLR